MWPIIGHDTIVAALERSLAEERLAHAYLFVGPEHVGKTTLALTLAQALNCRSEARPCGQCSACRRIAQGKHPDVLTLRLSLPEESESSANVKTIGVDQIREMERIIGFKPYEGRYRVVIIAGGDSMSEGAANSLLKTLEEPPADTVLILLAVDESAVLPTIASRCRRFDLRPLPVPRIEQALIETYAVPAGRARVLARLCRGGIGWAIEAAGDEDLLEDRAGKLEALLETCREGIVSRFQTAAALAEDFGKRRQAVREQLELWLEWWRDVMLTRGGYAEGIANVDREQEIRRHASQLALPEITAAMKAVQTALRQLERNANPRLVLDVMMLALPAIPDERERIHA